LPTRRAKEIAGLSWEELDEYSKRVEEATGVVAALRLRWQESPVAEPQLP
jgi:hypothetical protein